jgi:hypothetical protein
MDGQPAINGLRCFDTVFLRGGGLGGVHFWAGNGYPNCRRTAAWYAAATLTEVEWRQSTKVLHTAGGGMGVIFPLLTAVVARAL